MLLIRGLGGITGDGWRGDDFEYGGEVFTD